MSNTTIGVCSQYVCLGQYRAFFNESTHFLLYGNTDMPLTNKMLHAAKNDNMANSSLIINKERK